MSAAAAERPEKVPVLEERFGTTRTYKTRHSTSGPRNRGHPCKRSNKNEKRSVPEKQLAQRVDKQQHSWNAAKEQEPKNRAPPVQITPSRLE